MFLQSLTRPRLLLRLEGLALLIVIVLLYTRSGSGWGLFALLFLVPDLAALGYVFGKGTGAALYNLTHTEVFPALLAAYGLLSDTTLFLALALIWLSHIQFDRLIGYGLKYVEVFKETHLNRV